MSRCADGMFEIDAQRANAEIALDESRRRVDILVLSIMAESVEPAFAGLDFDDLGAVARQQPAGIRAGVPVVKVKIRTPLRIAIRAQHGSSICYRSLTFTRKGR